LQLTQRSQATIPIRSAPAKQDLPACKDALDRCL
jgi:hypothetical protein